MTQSELSKKAQRIKQANEARKVRPTYIPMQPKLTVKEPRRQHRQHRQHRQQSADGDGESSDGDDAAVRLISKEQVCSRVNVSFPAIWKWIRQNRFPCGRSIGARTMWLESEVEAWILSQPERSYKKFKDGEAA